MNVLEQVSENAHISWFWGICAESTRDKGQRKLEIYVPDLTPIRNGDVKNKGSKTKSKLFNVVSQSWEEYEAKLSKTILAEYLGFESSREAPDMYKGQQVMVVNYGCNDRWFWIPLERDDYIKSFEHVKFRCNDLAVIHKKGLTVEDDERLKDLTDDNTYFLEIDTKYKKHVFISTAGTDAEKYRYFLKMDAKEHTIELWDGLVDQDDPDKKCKNVPHNTIKLESDPAYSQGAKLKGRITLQNEAGCTLILEDEDMKVMVPRDLTINVGRNVLTHVVGSVGTSIESDHDYKLLGNLTKYVGGTVKKQVVMDYEYLYGMNKREEITQNYERYTGTAVTETVGTNQTVTCGKLFKVSVGGTVITMDPAKLALNGATTVISGKAMSFAFSNIVTSAHIFGCCGCLGH